MFLQKDRTDNKVREEKIKKEQRQEPFCQERGRKAIRCPEQ